MARTLLSDVYLIARITVGYRWSASVNKLQKMTPRESGPIRLSRVEIAQANFERFSIDGAKATSRSRKLEYRRAGDLEDVSNRGSQDLIIDEMYFS